MGQEFESDVYRKGRELLVVLRGRLVMQYCPEFKTRLSGLLGPQAERVFLDLTQLTFLDSSGLGLLIGLKMLANRACVRLVLLALPSRISEVLRIAKLDAFFEIRDYAESEVVRATMAREELAIWRDGPGRQDLMPTQAAFTPSLPTGWTQPSTSVVAAADGDAQKVAQACADGAEYLRQGDYPRAADAYRRALAIDAEHLAALNNLAIICEKRPEWYPQAIEAWQKMLKLSQVRSDGHHAQRARKHLEVLEKLMRVY